MIKNETSVKSFWNGILIGSGAALFILYVFGTKKGRSSLKTILDFSENIEDNLHKLHKHVLSLSNKKTQSKERVSLLESVSSVIDKIKLVSKHA